MADNILLITITRWESHFDFCSTAYEINPFFSHLNNSSIWKKPFSSVLCRSSHLKQFVHLTHVFYYLLSFGKSSNENCKEHQQKC